MQLPHKEYIEPLYERVPVHHDQFQEHLEEWSRRLKMHELAKKVLEQDRHPTPHKTTAGAALHMVAGRDPQIQMRPDASILTVDVLIPSFRADPARLRQLFAAGESIPRADMKFLVQIDNSHVTPETESWLEQQQMQMLNRLKVRRNPVNLGAGLTRNVLLDNSHAEYVIMLDDDVVPTPETFLAYIEAFKSHPEAAGFAGKCMAVLRSCS